MPWLMDEESPVSQKNVNDFKKIDGNTTSCSINRIKENARIRLEQDVDLVLKNIETKIFGQSHDEVVMMKDLRYKNCKANEDRINLKEGLLFRTYFGKAVSVKYCQILISKQLVGRK